MSPIGALLLREWMISVYGRIGAGSSLGAHVTRGPVDK
jgi:hypothetical protein